MNQAQKVDLTLMSKGGHSVELEASPEDLRFRLSDFALVIVDMQNGFAKSQSE